MVLHFNKIYIYSLFFISLFFLSNCQLKEPLKNHGILFLENRAKKLEINKSNKNDVINTIGYPHSTSIADDDQWIYIERILTKGEFLKLGQNILKANNVLVLEFNKYGVLKNKIFLDKNSKEKIAFSDDITENQLSQKSFVQRFLYSLKTKMYGNK